MGNSNCFQQSSDDDDDDEEEGLTGHQQQSNFDEPVTANASGSQHVRRQVAADSHEPVADQRVSASAPAAAGSFSRVAPHGRVQQSTSRRVQDEEEEDQRIKLAQKMAFIYQIPTGMFDGSKKARECIICMVDFEMGDSLRYLPCMHAYHQSCIDDWLLRSFTCPSCMQPVDAALLATFDVPDD